MEWPSKACRFRTRDFRAFKYEERSSRVITVRLDDTSDLEVKFSYAMGFSTY